MLNFRFVKIYLNNKFNILINSKFDSLYTHAYIYIYIYIYIYSLFFFFHFPSNCLYCSWVWVFSMVAVISSFQECCGSILSPFFVFDHHHCDSWQTGVYLPNSPPSTSSETPLRPSMILQNHFLKKWGSIARVAAQSSVSLGCRKSAQLQTFLLQFNPPPQNYGQTHPICAGEGPLTPSKLRGSGRQRRPYCTSTFRRFERYTTRSFASLF